MTTHTDHGEATIRTRSHLALHDDFLRTAVRFTADKLRNKKKETTDEFGNWEEWRERGRQIRSHTVAHLDYYIKEFSENVKRAGGTVHFAADASEAAQTVMQIAKGKQAKRIVKSKSMVSEEVHINHHLEQAGMNVVETDLGEYIIQLAGETPSHIIIPAIHKNREQIRALFASAGGQGLTTDTKKLASFARQKLREEFITADIGITGCNFGIAESGTVVLFTNEGNADMVTNLPDTHIVMMGMERVLPTFADLEVIANLLPRSATGQKLTTYMSMITGPRKKDEGDGAKELHVVILDNGRSQQLGDDQFQDVLNCIRCGACLNVCPVYRQIGGHAYGSVYPGPIGAVLTPLLNQGPEFTDLPFASSLCGACSEACPVKIPLHDMLVHLRQRNVERGNSKLLERLAFKGYRMAFATVKRYRLAMKIGKIVQGPLVTDDHIESKVGPLAGWTDARFAPKLASTSFRDQWQTLSQQLKGGSDRE